MHEHRHQFEGLVPEQLLRALRDRRCILFAGAGLSAQAKGHDGSSLPTWNTLLVKMLDWCIENRDHLRAEPAEFRDLLGRGRFLVVAQRASIKSR
jgi:hypothetical protein